MSGSQWSKKPRSAIARLCAATNAHLHIVGVTGFRMDDRTLKRAGLDYWDEVTLHRHLDLSDLSSQFADARLIYFTTKTEGLGGIGLPMVEQFATSAGGSIGIASEPGTGTVATLRLPTAGNAPQLEMEGQP